MSRVARWTIRLSVIIHTAFIFRNISPVDINLATLIFRHFSFPSLSLSLSLSLSFFLCVLLIFHARIKILASTRPTKREAPSTFSSSCVQIGEGGGRQNKSHRYLLNFCRAGGSYRGREFRTRWKQGEYRGGV